MPRSSPLLAKHPIPLHFQPSVRRTWKELLAARHQIKYGQEQIPNHQRANIFTEKCTGLDQGIALYRWFERKGETPFLVFQPERHRVLLYVGLRRGDKFRLPAGEREIKVLSGRLMAPSNGAFPGYDDIERSRG